MAKTSTKVFVLEVMGRHAGWITAAVGMAEDAATPIPLVLLFPEIAFDEAKFLAAVDAKVKRFGYCCVGVSEGLKNAAGALMAEAGTKDAFGHAQLGGVGPLDRDARQGEARATSITGPWPTTCSARRATSRRRPISTTATPSAGGRASSRSRDRTP